ncbi:hypothetical protein QP995_04210 [Corynebacterium sp. MSK032]|uniref:hypothetical protein n=1 Tax=Corynebacterium TaxID=1716 RepID=UPI00066850A1|nr:MULTISPECIES: hypothetical protein [Corynebacterium]MCG7269066.1 hypothetical protein [Corynebacterium amycolatum]MDK8792828.1 hypothetical protein [Corynebacterium sp. MSK032]
MTTDLRSIGMDYPSWRDAMEAAIASDNLSVIGEVRGGQLVRFEDSSGARLHILGVEPFSTYAGFAGSPTVTAHVSSVDDVLALVEIVEDDPSSDNFDKVIEVATCLLSQGPMIVDAGTQTFEHVALSALATDFTLDASIEEYEKRTGATPTTLDFEGAKAIVGDQVGKTSPSATVKLAGVINNSRKHVNELTGKKFWVLNLALPTPMDVLVPGGDEAPQPGMVVSGTFSLTGEIIPPQGCGGGCGDGGCGCGDGGCGGH